MPGVEGYFSRLMWMGILTGILVGIAFLLSPVFIGMMFFFIGLKKLRDGIRPRKKRSSED
jgi:hypothetical protein